MGLKLEEGFRTPIFKRGNKESRINLVFKSTEVSCCLLTTEWIYSDHSALLTRIKLQPNLPPALTKMAVEKLDLKPT